MCDCELPTIYDDTERTARKGLWSGSWSAYAVCLPCAALRVWAQRLADGCDCIVFGQLFDVLREEQTTVRRLVAFPLQSQSIEDHARMGALLGHLYKVLLADADREAEEYRVWLAAKSRVVAA